MEIRSITYGVLRTYHFFLRFPPVILGFALSAFPVLYSVPQRDLSRLLRKHANLVEVWYHLEGDVHAHTRYHRFDQMSQRTCCAALIT